MSGPKPGDLAHFIAEAITECGGIEFDLHEPPTINYLGVQAIDAKLAPLVKAAEKVCRNHKEGRLHPYDFSALRAALKAVR